MKGREIVFKALDEWKKEGADQSEYDIKASANDQEERYYLYRSDYWNAFIKKGSADLKKCQQFGTYISFIISRHP